MKNLAQWALFNPIKSQIIISIAQILLAIAAIYSGVWLFSHDIFIPKFFVPIGLGLFFIALIFYPLRRARHRFWKMSFARQKIMDGMMLLSYMIIVVSISNHDARSAWREMSEEGLTAPVVLGKKYNVSPESYKANKKKKLSAKEKRSLRKKIKKEFKQFVKRMKQKAAHDKEASNKAAGAVIIILLLMVLVAILSCAIACSGANFLGLLLLVGGWTLLIAAGISWVRKIKGTRKKNYQPASDG